MQARTRSTTVAAALVASGALALALGAGGAQGAPSGQVVNSTANGNAFLGGLSFAPADITVGVGGVVAWRNTDLLAPHTVTERHGLWSLGGNYLKTPINPPGFAPGTTVRREFEAGTQDYYCTVHPKQMTGTISVPVDVSSQRKRVRSKARRAGGRRRVRTVAIVFMRWAAESPAEGLAFDVQRRLPGGEWRPFADGTSAASGSFHTTPDRTWEIRARLRSATSADQATGWSPVVAVTG